jgi:hypothetical protein
MLARPQAFRSRKGRSRGMRLGSIPAFADQAALKLLRPAAARVDAAGPGTQPTHVEVTTRWLHGTDERIALESIPPVQATYPRALLILLNAS